MCPVVWRNQGKLIFLVVFKGNAVDETLTVLCFTLAAISSISLNRFPSQTLDSLLSLEQELMVWNSWKKKIECVLKKEKDQREESKISF